MKNTLILSVAVALFATSSCKTNEPEPTTPVTTSQVLNDFAYKLANPNYADIKSKAIALNDAVQALNTTTNSANLSAARSAWKNLRQSWEQCESFLFGPVEDFNYDPMMDTWPVNRIDLDSLLTSSNALTVSDIEVLTESLKGFHPLEYMIWGEEGNKTAGDFTAREKLYMVSLSQNLTDICTNLHSSWDASGGNFTHEIVNAGNGGTYYTSRRDAMIAIVNAMAGICDEVANGKMEEPLAQEDSTLEESQFAHNSTTDFKNNMKGVLNAYLGKYTDDGYGVNDLVNAKNIGLDNSLQSQMNTAIAAFDNINSNYGLAIFTQQIQIHNAQDAINDLKETLETDLMNFVLANIND